MVPNIGGRERDGNEMEGGMPSAREPGHEKGVKTKPHTRTNTHHETPRQGRRHTNTSVVEWPSEGAIYSAVSSESMIWIEFR